MLLLLRRFPTAARATCHGLSAGSGKLGAAIGSYAFGTLIDSLGLRGTFVLTSALSAVLLLITLLFVPRYDVHMLHHLDEAHRVGAVSTLLYRPSLYFARRHLQNQDGAMRVWVANAPAVTATSADARGNDETDER